MIGLAVDREHQIHRPLGFNDRDTRQPSKNPAQAASASGDEFAQRSDRRFAGREGRLGRALYEDRHAGGVELDQLLDLADQGTGQGQPANPEASHAPGLREGVRDDQSIVIVRAIEEGRCPLTIEGESFVGLVSEHPDAVAPAMGADDRDLFASRQPPAASDRLAASRIRESVSREASPNQNATTSFRPIARFASARSREPGSC